ncbi:ATP-dependent DNA helicase Rep [bioreactor metagenome]|uniref:DNA 3'-5' helicase n=1 Tax=bioreactor metagenome TaxID=1076179 RepID=A0A644W8M6_9ZZZZ|nr:ATP-dependent helicase [Methanobrevibacter sp.]MEA4957821.1 ATP-dependent helicase [Methanobrevibacter sp.]
MKNNNVELDDIQRKIVYSNIKQNIIVNAPPGSGKTTIMAKRIDYLIQNHLIKFPFRILGLTFSNAAANEMKSRLFSNELTSKLQITTFHSFAFSILKSYANYIGLKNDFKILSDHESKKLKRRLIIKHFNKELNEIIPQNKKNQIDIYQEKYKVWINETLLKCNNYKSVLDSKFNLIMNEYRQKLKDKNVLDYDYLLYYSNMLFESNSNVLKYYSSSFRYMVIDEFQDTNVLQFNLIKKIILSSNNLVNILVLCDSNQAIYAFQGATTENIENAKKEFNCKEFNLKKDYRISSPEIKKIKINVSLKIDDFYTTLMDENEKIPLNLFDNENNELRFVMKILNELIKDGVDLEDIAIIAPVEWRLKNLKRHLLKNSIDHVYVPSLSKSKIIEKYKNIFDSLLSFKNENNTLNQTIFNICSKNRVNVNTDAIKLLISISKRYDKKYNNLSLNDKIEKFYNEFLLDINIEDLLKNSFKDKIFLSTIHGVKGLEFENVIIIGLENKVIPHHSVCEKCNNGENVLLDELSDALKLLYVGITRAKNKLYLTGIGRRTGIIKHGTCLLKGCSKYIYN